MDKIYFDVISRIVNKVPAVIKYRHTFPFFFLSIINRIRTINNSSWNEKH